MCWVSHVVQISLASEQQYVSFGGWTPHKMRNAHTVRVWLTSLFRKCVLKRNGCVRTTPLVMSTICRKHIQSGVRRTLSNHHACKASPPESAVKIKIWKLSPHGSFKGKLFLCFEGSTFYAVEAGLQQYQIYHGKLCLEPFIKGEVTAGIKLRHIIGVVVVVAVWDSWSTDLLKKSFRGILGVNGLKSRLAEHAGFFSLFFLSFENWNLSLSYTNGVFSFASGPIANSLNPLSFSKLAVSNTGNSFLFQNL